MGSYTFTWEHLANEVLVTGTFDNWQQTVKLKKIDGIFQKEVQLPKEHTQYKFIVDGTWCANESAPKTSDNQGGHNNVLTPDDIKEPISTLSSAAPESSTAALAGDVPKEDVKSTSDDSVPGAFPMTPPAETPSTEPMAFSVNPIPATEGAGNPIKLAPGEPVPDPSTFTSNTIQSTVKLDEEPAEEKVSVAPIPATAGIGNPIHLAPGEKVPDPSTLTSNTISSTIKTDAASYENSDALPPQLGPVVVTPEAESEAKGGMFSLPPLTGSLIPESSLPKDASVETEEDPGVTIQSAAPTSTTAALAGNVPLEPKAVPEAVTASEEKAKVDPEAAAPPETVEEKKEVEEEFKAEVPEEPVAIESPSVAQVGTVAAAAAITATAGAALTAAAAATSAVKDEAAETVGSNGQAIASDVPEVVAESVPEVVAESVPEVVAESIPEVVAESVPEVVAESVPEVVAESVPEVVAESVPEVVAESQKEAHVSPEASANAEAVEEKKEVEEELKAKIPEEPATAEGPSAVEIGAAAAVAATATAGAFAAATYAAKDKAAETVGLNGQVTASDVPDIVAESQKEAHASPEASANAEAVEEKKEVEEELKAKVPEEPAATESSPTAEVVADTTVDTSATVGAVVATTSVAKDEAAETVESNGQVTASDVPEVVAESQKEAHASPEASANAEAVEEKKEVEAELLKEVEKTEAAGEPAPTIAAETSQVAPGLSDEALVDSKPLKSSSEPDALAVVNAAGALPTEQESSKAEPAQPEAPKAVDSRDVSPMSKQPITTTEQTQPAATTEVESHTAEAKTTPETPKNDSIAGSALGTPESVASGVTDKKKKRRSFFGRIKDKLKN